jgi:hypothetical protein
MRTSGYLPGTSGHALPRILRLKLRKYPPSPVPEGFAIPACAESSTTEDSTHSWDDESQPPTSNRRVTSSRVVQLEEVIHKSTQALLGVHKQIQRGEEVYYEDAYGFGGLFTGFDGVLDARGVGEGGGGGGSANMLRRMPGDARWFSLPLHVYPPIPPPVITNRVPVTFEAASSSCGVTGSAETSETSPFTSNEKGVSSPSKRHPETEIKSPGGDKDEGKAVVDDEDHDDEEDDALGEDDAEVTPVAVAEPRETRSKRKSMTPVPTRRTNKRRKR